MGMPKVWNIKDPNCPPLGKSVVFCGRPTKWSNPFRIGVLFKGKRMTRDDVCNRYDNEILPWLDVSPLRGKDLVCYCAPARCHCDSILRKANP